MTRAELTPDERAAITYVARKAVDGYRAGLREKVRALRALDPEVMGGYGDGEWNAYSQVLRLIDGVEE